MKKFLKMAVLAVLLIGHIVNLHADLIVCPQDDFFLEHEEECDYVGRLYQAAGEDGFVYVYSSPVSNEIVGEIPNGVDIWIDFTYETEDGVVWGVQTPRYDLSLGQWMNLTEFEITKTREDFEQEYQNGIETIKETYTFGEQNGVLILWEYPGSKHISGQIDSGYVDPEDTIAITKKYTDEEGQHWLFIDFDIRQCGWIQENQALSRKFLQNYWYLDQGTYAAAKPTPQSVLPTPRVPMESSKPSHGDVNPYIKKRPEPMLMIGAGIAGVIVLTTLVVARFWKKR